MNRSGKQQNRRSMLLVFLASALGGEVQALEEFEPELPLVLSAVRLQQPLAEVPASVTVIDADQIRQWGVTRVVDIFRYVPGMFVGDELDTRSTSVVYHSGDVSLARRLEVLVDGRSVYESTFARVDWDRIGVAVEDIERVEVTRSPSASSYGLNAFQGVVNIITRHPADSASADLSVSYASDQQRHGYASIGGGGDVQHRISVFADRVGEYGGFHHDTGSLPDLRANKAIAWSAATRPDDSSELEWQVSRQLVARDVYADENFMTDSPLQESTTDVLWGRYTRETSADHQWQLKAYWSGNNTESDYSACAPTIAFSEDLGTLYRQNPGFAETLGYSVLGYQQGSAADRTTLGYLYAAIASGRVSADALESLLATRGYSVEISDSDLALAQSVMAGVITGHGLDETVCGTGDLDIYEQRTDIEWQDTRTWSPQLRSVQGIGWRRDRVSSRTYFDGEVGQDSWSAFFNIEYKPLPDWLLFSGLMAEYERESGVHYSPRLASTWRLANNQSVRVHYSRSHRSPDLAERYLNASVTLSGLGDNYLGSDTGTLFLQARSDAWKAELKDEVIQAWEAGYFGSWLDSRLTVDTKIFHERLSRLIGSSVSLLDSDLDNGGSLRMQGIEWQASLHLAQQQRLWLVGMLQDRKANDEATADLLLGAERSLRMIWTRESGFWEQMLGVSYDQADVGAGSNYSSSEHYRQRKWQARLGRELPMGTLAWQVWYDADAGNVNFERNQRWLNGVTYRYRW
ncbi:TonB-dependent receptor plug domain-containing protein [Parathalassolituus penaei]|uniref:TonB-dependent receptor n=1 Tax=Parathalassolituus penaei TaxID=2997323 RepID=A0A9X3ENC4_9GAMM|nr:TonB-dependent receptor [Parathalassolituus penaei]MCY0967336.1 TonB-dependent receptor [Parathalassolituus penaei]